jgi:hypothetical protein
MIFRKLTIVFAYSILLLQNQKADLAASALDGGSSKKVQLTQKERDFLFKGGALKVKGKEKA